MVSYSNGSGGGGGFFGGGGPGGNSNWDLNTIFNTSSISPKTLDHLRRVYMTLFTSVATCAGGMWLNSTFITSGFFVSILIMVGLGFCMYQIQNPNNTESAQIGWLWGLAFAMGWMSGPGMHMIADVHPGMLTQATLYTGTAFSSFSALAVFSERRSLLFLGGIIMTLL